MEMEGLGWGAERWSAQQRLADAVEAGRGWIRR